MKFLEGHIYLSFDEAVEAGISRGTLKWSNYENATSWVFTKDPEDNRRTLVQYDALKDKYKKKIEATYGDVYKYYKDQTIRTLIKENPTDRIFIQKLPISEKRKSQYISACRYLSLISSVTKKELKKLGYNSIKNDFYPALINIMKHDDSLPKKFPLSYVKLTQKAKAYKEGGASAIINGNLNNKNPRKTNEFQDAVIRDLINKHNKFDYEQVTRAYNKIAVDKGWVQLSSGTIKNRYKALELNGGRNGYQIWRNTFDYTIGRERPSRPGYLWEGDGTPYELLYQKDVANSKGHKITKYWKRKIVYVVTDAFNDLIVGLSIHDSENAMMTKRAWKNAVEMTGILPYQIKTDNFARKELTPFYQSITHQPELFTPAAVGNARDKRIEALFGRLNKFVAKVHPNHSGHNILAKNQPNREFLDKIKKDFPDEDGVIDQILFDIYAWNNMPRKNLGGKSLFQQWNEAMKLAENDNDVRKADTIQKLKIFGETNPRTIKLTNRGIVFKGNSYINFDLDFYSNIGKSFKVVYDKDNLDRILASADDGRIEVVVEKFDKIPGCLKDMKKGDRERLNKALDFKKQVRQHFLIDKQAERTKLIKEAGLEHYLETETLAKLMLIVDGQQKGLNYKSQEAIQQPNSSNIDEFDLYDEDYEPIEFTNKTDDFN